MPAATDGHTSQPRGEECVGGGSESAHAGLRSIRTSARDFDKVRLEEQRADWQGVDDLMVSCWRPFHAQRCHLQNQCEESLNNFRIQGILRNITL